MTVAGGVDKSINFDVPIAGAIEIKMRLFMLCYFIYYIYYQQWTNDLRFDF